MDNGGLSSEVNVTLFPFHYGMGLRMGRLRGVGRRGEGRWGKESREGGVGREEGRTKERRGREGGREGKGEEWGRGREGGRGNYVMTINIGILV